MCFDTRKIYGYVCKDERNVFVYCCRNCKLEFNNGYDLETHTSEHDIDQNRNSVESEIENDVQVHQATQQNHTLNLEHKKEINKIKSKKTETESKSSTFKKRKQQLLSQVLNLEAHMKTHTEEKPYRCTFCPAQFSRNSLSMREHIRKHSDGSKKLICSFCETVVFTNRDFTRHISKCNPSKENGEIINRIKSTCNRNQGECVLCGAKVKNLRAHFRAHLRSHSIQSRLQCSMCDRTFTQNGHRNAHIRQVHNVEPNTNITDDQHKSIDNEYSCKTCERNFNSIIDLDDHMKVHITNDRLCKICSRVVATGCITSHLRTHAYTGWKKHNCTICYTSFIRKDHLEEHLNLHPGYKKPYQCSVEECDEAFFSTAAYKRHMKIHSNPNESSNEDVNKTILCSMCGKQIRMKNIVLHMRVHSNYKPHKCSFCPLSFTQKSNLNTHIRGIHTEEKPYRCEPCSKSFHSACALNSHKRRHKTESGATLK